MQLEETQEQWETRMIKEADERRMKREIPKKIEMVCCLYSVDGGKKWIIHDTKKISKTYGGLNWDIDPSEYPVNSDRFEGRFLIMEEE
jgi:hypothetical protein